MVLRICRLVAGSTDVEDVWSETFLAALAALPPKQRSSVAYHDVAGLRYEDVGELIGSSEAAARRAAADGIASMRRTLNRKVG